MNEVKNCLIINLDSRPDLWNNTVFFRNKWTKIGKQLTRISGVDYKNKQNVLNDFIITNRINLNATGLRNTKSEVLGELGCFMGHYTCWKYVVDNNLKNCLILEDGINIIRDDFQNMSIDNELDILFVNEEMNQRDSNKHFLGYGLQGYVITQKGAQLLLEHCCTLSAPIDLQLRHLCNIKIFKADTLTNPYVKRDNNRESSIAGFQTVQTDLNGKQNPSSVIQRIITNLLKQNVNLDDYL